MSRVFGETVMEKCKELIEFQKPVEEFEDMLERH
jgi:hypothetical protein